MAVRFWDKQYVFLSSLGVPRASGKVYSYDASTSTPRATYSDDDLDTANAVLLTLNGSGRLTVDMFGAAVDYKFIVTNSDGTDSITIDPVHGNGDAGIVTFTQSGTGAVSKTVEEEFLYGKPVNVYEFLTTAQQTNVVDYTGSIDVTAGIQNALDESFNTNRNTFAPSGLYKVTTVQFPGTAAGRTHHVGLEGQGCGEVFARGLDGGTIFKSTTNAPVLEHTPSTPVQGSGNADITRMRFEGDSTTPVVHLRAFYSQSIFHHNAIWNAGAGGGFKSELSNTGEVHSNYAVNDDYATAGLDAARTGIGFELINTISTGLTMLRKNTSRGFRTGYKIGDASGNRLYSFKIEHCECSLNYYGIWLTSDVQSATVDSNYLEGGEEGIGILNEGSFNTITNNLILGQGADGFSVAIDCSDGSIYGTYIGYNLIGLAARPNSIGINVASSGTYGGANKTLIGNRIIYTSGTAGVSGIKVAGLDPRINLIGTSFQPRGPWPGAGTKKINDISTSSDTTVGSGVYGWFLAEDYSQNVEVPHVGRGSLCLAADLTSIVNAKIAAGVCTLSGLSVFKMELTSAAVAITEFAAPNLPDKRFSIWVVTTAGGPLFTNGAKLKLAGSANYTPGAAGCMIEFQIFPGGVAIEVARTVF